MSERAQKDKVYRRRQFIVDFPLQVKYGIFFALICLCLSSAWGFSLYNARIKSLENEYIIRPGEDSKLEEFLTAQRYVSFTTTAMVLASTAAFFIIGLYGAHKLAGPSYRLKKELQGIIGGNYPKTIKLRKNDLLHDLAYEIEKLSSSLNDKKQQKDEKIKAVLELLLSLKNEYKNETIEEIKKLLGSIDI
ncbi:MAG: hypothetical protein JW728_01330 [Candidatus Aureabacteria bacterium]|nr:hypothetical protein [Candidatus Auribacterota bacterium]